MSEAEQIEALKQNIKLVVQRLDTEFERMGDVVELVRQQEFSDQTLADIADFITNLLNSISRIDYSFVVDNGLQTEIDEFIEEIRKSCAYIEAQLAKKDDASFDSVEIVREYETLERFYNDLKVDLDVAM